MIRLAVSATNITEWVRVNSGPAKIGKIKQIDVLSDG